MLFGHPILPGANDRTWPVSDGRRATHTGPFYPTESRTLSSGLSISLPINRRRVECLSSGA